jgi:hypothetical protein
MTLTCAWVHCCKSCTESRPANCTGVSLPAGPTSNALGTGRKNLGSSAIVTSLTLEVEGKLSVLANNYSETCEIRTPMGRAKTVPNEQELSFQGAILH